MTCLECSRLGPWKFCADEPTRIIACSCCGGDGGGYEGGNARWIRCDACAGKGEVETELEPVSLEEMEDAVWSN
jgi:hypothetical protein